MLINKVGKRRDLRKKNKITLKDIANATGLSMNTVSKVINEKPYYTKEVEKKVKKAISELGYIPDSVASSLRRGTSKTVAIVFDDLINPYYSMMTLTIAQHLSNASYDLMMFSNYGQSSFLDKSLLLKVIGRKVDAIISFLEPEKDAIEVITRLNLQFLLIGRKVNSSVIESVCSMEDVGGEIATTHLIEKGHNDILYVGAHPEISTDVLRFNGYKKALEKNNIDFNPANIGYFYEHKSIKALVENFILKRTAKAIFCFNDIFSFGIIKELKQLNYKLPRDYVLVGYDNIQKYLGLADDITTIGTNHEYMAEMAVKVILHKIKPSIYESVVNEPHPVYLVKGYTT